MSNIENKAYIDNEFAYINSYSNLHSPDVKEEIDVYTYLHRLYNPEDFIYEKIEQARNHYKNGNKQYDKIKEELPCYTLNFGFRRYKANRNIIGSTGFIYLDVDNKTEINLSNDLIFASWKSLSNTGRGILVKIDGLNLQNLNSNYNYISNKLGINADKHASKATQFTVQSFDQDVYINDSSITLNAIEDATKPQQKVHNLDLLSKKRNDSTILGNKMDIRYNNINDYDFKGSQYILFEDDKENIKELFIPNKLSKGERNTKLYSIGMQFRGLNPFVREEDVERLLYSINMQRCVPSLNKNDLKIIVNSVIGNKNPQATFTKQRRIIFDPDQKLTRQEKAKITGREMGKFRSKKTYSQLKDLILNWDFNENGKVTIKSLTTVSNRHKNTVEKYYPQLRKDIDLIDQFKKNKLKNIKLV